MSTPTRSVSEYVFSVLPELVNNRVVDSAILLRVMPPVPKGVASTSAFFAMLGKEKATQLEAKLNVSFPSKNASWAERNSQVILTPKPGSGLVGDMKMWYTRLSVKFVMNAISSIARGDAQHVHDLIPALSAATGVSFVKDDFINDPIPANVRSIAIRPYYKSFFFTGDETATVNFDSTPLSTVITVLELNGLVAPIFLAA